MQAWECANPVGVEALAWRALPMPEPKAGEVLVEIKAASLNFPDKLIVENKYQFKPPLPFVPGSEFAGIVQAVGEGVAHLQVGQRVICLHGTGGFATHACLPAILALPMPAGFTFEDGASLLMTYATTIHALVDRAALQAGQTVLVMGAAGGVGTAAIQIAKAAGAKVIAAASSQAKCDLAQEIGADAVINYGAFGDAEKFSEAFRAAIKAASESLGTKAPDVVYDPIGGQFAEPAFRSIAWRGRYLVIGFASGPIPALPLNLALLKGASIVGVFWGDFTKREPKAFMAQYKQLATWYAEGKIKPVIDRTMPMSDLKSAYAHMATRGVRGKVVMVN
ncbi:MAG: NADPH:quinone oxidoreductase family protein [Brachymonas sp.]|nr:NADPH:quinone oxidoreductase family protein [Brachymonas sp.]